MVPVMQGIVQILLLGMNLSVPLTLPHVLPTELSFRQLETLTSTLELTKPEKPILFLTLTTLGPLLWTNSAPNIATVLPGDLTARRTLLRAVPNPLLSPLNVPIVLGPHRISLTLAPLSLPPFALYLSNAMEVVTAKVSFT